MKAVGARFLVGADAGASGATVLGAHAVGEDRKVLDRLERWVNVNRDLAEIVVVIGSVEQVSGTGFSVPTGGGVHGQAGLHLRRQKGQGRKDVAVDQGSVLNGRA